MTAHLSILMFRQSLFRHVFRDVLAEKGNDDDTTYGSRNPSSFSMRGREKESDTPSIAMTSVTSSVAYTENQNIERRLEKIAEQIKVPKSVVEIVGHHLLGNSKLKMSKVEKAPDIADIIKYMAKIFIRAISHAEMVVLALDDVHFMDSLSWKVVRCIFEESKNVLIVCASHSMESFTSTVDNEFRELLTSKYKDENRFTDVHLNALEKKEIQMMAAKVFTCKPQDVDDEVSNDVYLHSRGVPYFASEILNTCFKNKLIEKLANNKIGWNVDYKKVSTINNATDLFSLIRYSLNFLLLKS